MSDKKTISKNPKLFSFSETNGTRKKKSSEKKINKPIKIKTANNKTTKGRILRYIREQQEKNYKKLFEENIINKESKNQLLKPPLDVSSEYDFENSINYLKSIVEDEEKKKNENTNINNNTIKRRDPITSSAIINNVQNIANNVTETIVSDNIPLSGIKLSPILPVPKYGCLKNGKLPTYRTYMNQTRKSHVHNIPQNISMQPRYPGPTQHGGNIMINNPIHKSHISKPPININPIVNPNINMSQNINSIAKPTITNSNITPNIIPKINSTSPQILNSNPNLNIQENSTLNEKLKKISEMKQIKELKERLENANKPKNLKYLKRKKTLRKKYKKIK